MILLVDRISRIYQLVNAIIHLLNERSLYLLGIPMIYLHLYASACVYVCLCQTRNFCHTKQSTLCYIFVVPYNRCSYLSIHSSHLNGILQDDEVNAVFCNGSHPESS